MSVPLTQALGPKSAMNIPLAISSILGLLAMLLVGCATTPSEVPFGKRIAYIQFVDLSDKPYGRIWAVDHHHLNGDVRHRVRLSPGIHSIGYYCGNRVYIHWEPRVVHRFAAGKSYELSCNTAGEPQIKVL